MKWNLVEKDVPNKMKPDILKDYSYFLPGLIVAFVL